MYNITHRDSRVVIKTLAKEWVQVKMIVEDDKYGPDEEEDPWGRGIQVRNDAKMHTNFIHAKTLVSDNFYVIQTANLTYGGFNDQREYYVIGNDPYILNNLKLLFEKDRRGEEIRPEDIHPNLIVCPIDCREKITWLLRWAKESIYVENQYLEDPEIIDILYSQKHLDLKMIFPKDEDNVKIDIWWLQWNIRLLTTPRIHAKAILIDHKYLVISSINFSTNSLDNNREIGIVLTNKEAINKFLNTFEQDWERAK
jgi:cardiolipin synthase